MKGFTIRVEIPALDALVRLLTGEYQDAVDASTNKVTALTAGLKASRMRLDSAQTNNQ